MPKLIEKNFNTISNIAHNIEALTWAIISLSYLIDQFVCIIFPCLLEVDFRILDESGLIETFFKDGERFNKFAEA